MKVYREVLCPDCGKKYMTYIYDEYDVIIKQGDKYLQGWEDSCPKCNNNLFIEDNVLEGKRLEDYPDELIRRRFVLR